MKVTQPKGIEERCAVARKCVAVTRLLIPVLVDDMDDTAARAYCALPTRVFIVRAGGTLAHLGDRGKLDPATLERALERTLAGRSTPRRKPVSRSRG